MNTTTPPRATALEVKLAKAKKKLARATPGSVHQLKAAKELEIVLREVRRLGA